MIYCENERCPTCTFHGLQLVTDEGPVNTYWCDHCGALVQGDEVHIPWGAPGAVPGVPPDILTRKKSAVHE